VAGGDEGGVLGPVAFEGDTGAGVAPAVDRDHAVLDAARTESERFELGERRDPPLPTGELGERLIEVRAALTTHVVA